jgi:hypothetical protein
MKRKIKTGSLVMVRKTHSVWHYPDYPFSYSVQPQDDLKSGSILVFIKYISTRKTNKVYRLAECLLDGQKVYASIKHIYAIKGA